MAIGAPLTLALGAATFVLVPFVVPVAVLQAIAGVKVYAGRLRWCWVGVPCALIGLWLGLVMTSGLAAPVAWASLALNAIGIAAVLIAYSLD
jgi:hypothetical protein